MSKPRRTIDVVCNKCGQEARQYEDAEMYHFACPKRVQRGVIPKYVPVAVK